MNDDSVLWDDFRPAWWAPGPHLQSMWGRLARPRCLVLFRREIVETPDGDELVLDHVDAPPGAPRLLVLHGLEGSSFSVYVQGIAAAAGRLGFAVTALNFRSCARPFEDLGTMIPNRRPRFYHSGETGDTGFVVALLAAREPGRPLLAIGASLGGNVLLKWLGENRGQRLVRAAATLSVPYDLAAGAALLERGLGPVYVAAFLRSLKGKVANLAARFPEAAARIDLPAALASRTFFAFDDTATAPLHGFEGAADYYRRSSSLRFLPRIDTPTICINAEDDPFLPVEALRRAAAAASPAIRCVFTPGGGHVGWVSGPSPGRASYWAEESAVRWLKNRVV
jgi:predicted alpha/beta-fold hydrolase